MQNKIKLISRHDDHVLIQNLPLKYLSFFDRLTIIRVERLKSKKQKKSNKMSKTEIEDKKFDSAVKDIIQRDFFPILKESKNIDPSTNNFSLSTFCNTYAPETDSQFLKKVERDRVILLNSAPAVKLDKSLENDEINKYGRVPFNALFYTPQAKPPEPQLSITYQGKKKPTIAIHNTHFGNQMNSANIGPINYHPFTTESSSTESESEFEGRSKYRAELIDSFSAPPKVNKERLKKRQISNKGRELLKKLMK